MKTKLNISINKRSLYARILQAIVDLWNWLWSEPIPLEVKTIRHSARIKKANPSDCKIENTYRYLAWLCECEIKHKYPRQKTQLSIISEYDDTTGRAKVIYRFV
jgi:hypothetical protein